MKATQALHDLGQSLWLDNISRDILDNGALWRYILDLAVTGLTSNPSIFDAAIGSGTVYDSAIAAKSRAGKAGEALFVELALEDLRRAAELFRPVFEASKQQDGWVSMEVSPLLADDSVGTIGAAQAVHAQAQCDNLLVKIPGTAAGIGAIEECIFRGVSINVTLLFSREQYLAAAEAYLRGLERRMAAGLDLRVHSVASLFVSRWDTAINDRVPPQLRNRLGIAIAGRTHCAYRELLSSPRWNRLAVAGASPQRLLWASTGTKDSNASDTLYVEALATPGTINTLPEKTLLAFADHGKLGAVLPVDGGDAEAVLAEFSRAGVDVDLLAEQLQRDGAAAFVKSWQSLLQRIAQKSASLAAAGTAPPE